ncbi:MAG: YggS family pyridoxal phosphate-dependent enzyme [Fluviicola sp.]
MIKEALDSRQAEIPDNVILVAVSKTKPVSDIQEAYDHGHRVFGENRAQEMAEKYEQLPKDIEWHSIGHLQRNKVKYIAPFVSMIHAVDSMKLLKEINKEAEKNDRVIECLLQFHIAQEDSKYGMDFNEVQDLLESEELIEMRNISIVGLMGMATFTDDTDQIREEFRTLENYFQMIKSHYFKFNDGFKHISMGMSGDYPIAIEEGSTMVRVGSAIFGARK